MKCINSKDTKKGFLEVQQANAHFRWDQCLLSLEQRVHAQHLRLFPNKRKRDHSHQKVGVFAVEKTPILGIKA